MISPEAIRELEQMYPGKTVLKLPLINPTEVICEVEPSTDHPDRSLAVALIEKSQPHFHAKSTETYVLKQGSLRLYVEGEKKPRELIIGQPSIVLPWQVHYAEGEGALVEVGSKPGWTQADHFITSFK